MSNLFTKFQEKTSFWGFLFVGFLSFTGGVVIFAKVVPMDKDPDSAPRDVVLLFTHVFSNEGLLYRELNQYSPDLTKVGLEKDACDRYRCLLRISPSGKNYEMRLTKDGKTWFIRSTSPVPKLALAEPTLLEEKAGTEFR